MKYTPKYQDVTYNVVTTANKHIQSYFMRTDQSYYAPEDCRHAGGLPTVQIIIDNEQIQIGSKTIQTDVFTNCAYNIKKYETYSKCQDILCSLLLNEIKEFRIGVSSGDGDRADTGDGDHFDIQNDTTNDNKHNPNDSTVQLIFCDFIGRSDLISIIDILLNQINFKEIMLIPFSLSISFALGLNYCSFVYPSGFSFIDDHMLGDSFSPGVVGRCSLDDEDFVEDFSRLKPLDESLRYACIECKCKEGTEEKINAHISKEHKDGAFFYYTDSDNIYESFENRFKYLFGKEKAAKISGNLFSIGMEFKGAKPLADSKELAVQGAKLFNALECSKDCWMTGEEWRAVRLRVLKEKLLFFI